MKVRVRNFQTAKDTTVDIKGFTVVVGKSNTGKTSILRAVEASLFNDSITGCVRYGEKDAVVDVELPNFSYTWEKGETKNGYRVTLPDGTREYSKVGFQRPDEFEKVGFREFRIEGEQYPIRPQFAEWHSPIFLLNKTGKVITELIASVTRLDVINMAIRKCSTSLRRDRSTLKVREDDLKKMKRRSVEYDALDDIDVARIDALYKECQTLEASVEALSGYVAKLEALQASVAQFEAVDTISVPHSLPLTAPAKIREVEGYRTKLESTQALLGQFQAIDLIAVPAPVPSTNRTKIREVEGYLAKLTPIESALKAMDPLEGVVVPGPIPSEDLALVVRVGAWLSNMDSILGRLRAFECVELVTVPSDDLRSKQDEVVAVDGFLASLLKCGRDMNSVKAEIEVLEAELHKDVAAVQALRDQIQECPVCGRSEHV